MNADTPQVSRTSTAARRLVGAVATIVLSLAITAAPASAKTVYDYVYSGSAFNGADTFEPFDNSIAGLAYDAHREQILVARGVISKFTKNGAATPFSGLASPSTLIGGGGAIAVDQSGGPTDGNFVAAANVSGGNHRKFTVDGKEWTENATEFRENTCGVADRPAGADLARPSVRFHPLRTGRDRDPGKQLQRLLPHLHAQAPGGVGRDIR